VCSINCLRCKLAFSLSKVPVPPHVKNIAGSHRALSEKIRRVESRLSRLGQLEPYVRTLANRTNAVKWSKRFQDLEKSHSELRMYVKQLAEKTYGFAPHSELRKLATEHETHKNAVEKTFDDFEAELAALTAGHKTTYGSIAGMSKRLDDFQKDHKHWAEAIDHFLKVQGEVKENLKTFSVRQRDLLNSIKAHSTTQGRHEGKLARFEKELTRVKSLIPKTELAELTKAHQQYIEFVDARLKEHEQKQEHIDLVFRESLQRMEEFNNKFSAIRDNVNTFSNQLQAWQGRFAAVDQVAVRAGQINTQLGQIGTYVRALSNRVSQVERQTGSSINRMPAT
jgi:chromosome segregation ATPase